MQAEGALTALRAQFTEESGGDALARSARGGDLDAFEGLVRRYQRRVYGLAYRHLRQYDPERSFEPWFWRLAANVTASYRRRRPAASVQLPETTAAVAREDTLPLERALADLSGDLRLPVLLHYYLDLPLDAVAASMGLSLSAVKSRLHRARAVLRRVLVEEDR